MTGLLVDPSRPDEIARGMALMMTDKTLAQRLADAGFKRIRMQLTWEQVCRRINEMIADAL